MSEEQEKLQRVLEDRLNQVPEGSLDAEQEQKLLKIKTLPAEELGELMVEAAATRFHKPSLLTRLDDCANLLIKHLDLEDAKDIQLTTSGGMATMWRLRVGTYPSAIFSLLARFPRDSYPTVAGELRYSNLGEAASIQGVPFEEAQSVPWFVEQQVSSADPETYTRACLIEMGALEEAEDEPSF